MNLASSTLSRSASYLKRKPTNLLWNSGIPLINNIFVRLYGLYPHPKCNQHAPIYLTATLACRCYDNFPNSAAAGDNSCTSAGISPAVVKVSKPILIYKAEKRKYYNGLSAQGGEIAKQ